MPKVPVTPLDVTGAPLVGASVEFFVEPDDSRQPLTVSDRATMYSDPGMTAVASNPSTVPFSGTLELYTKSFQFLAIKVSRSGYGTRTIRFHEVIGTSPIGGG